MGKRKNSAPLFEVMAAKEGGKRLFSVPSWFKTAARADQAVAEPPRPVVTVKQPPGLDNVPAQPSRPPAVAPKAAAVGMVAPKAAAVPTDGTESVQSRLMAKLVAPAIVLQAGQRRVSLTYWMCLAAGLAVILVLAGVYSLGRSGSSKATQAAAAPPAATVPQAANGQAQKAPAAGKESQSGQATMRDMMGAGQKPDKLDTSGAAPAYNFETLQAEAFRRYNAGGTFLVVQGKVDPKDAAAIHEYLWNNKILAVVFDDGRVIDTRNHAGLSAQQLRPIVDEIEKLGASKDWALRSKYNFKQDHKDKPWTVTVPAGSN
jgi:hypothetical protein